MGMFDSFFGGDAAKEAKKSARRAEQAAEERKRNIAAGTARVRTAFNNVYTDQFYESLRKGLEAYYMPQVETQYQDAQRQSLYGLDRRGIRESSARADAFGQLQSRYNQAKQDVVRRGETLVGQRKGEVNRALESSIMQINAAEDPISAATIGAENARVNTYQADYSPLGQVFTDLTAALAMQRQLSDQGNNRYQTPSWLSWASSSGRERR